MINHNNHEQKEVPNAARKARWSDSGRGTAKKQTMRLLVLIYDYEFSRQLDLRPAECGE